MLAHILRPYRTPILILTPLLLIAMSTCLFRGWMSQGMEMDEVSRVVNVIPLLNENAEPTEFGIFKISLFGHQFNLMYKQYISSAYLVRFLPLALFDDYLFGIRLLYLIYFLLGALAFFFFAQRHSPYVAAAASLMMVTTPLIYPEVRIGFVQTLHWLLLTASAWMLHRFIVRPARLGSLFGGVFLLAFAVNQSFYVAWTAVGAVLASLILYPDYWKRLANLKSLSVATAAAALGLFHFVWYNLAQGFPTLMTAYYFLFDREKYNQNPVDYGQALPFLDDLRNKLIHLDHFYGPNSNIYLLLALLMISVFLLSIIRCLRQGRLREERIYYFPFLILVAVFSLILLSPKGTRPGHFSFIIPFEQLSMVSCILLTGRLIPWKAAAKWFVLGAPVLLVLLNFSNSNDLVRRENRTGGTVLFTPAVFEFNDYLREQKIDSRNIVFLVWGLYAQPYFLNKGEFHTNNLVYLLYDKKEPEEREEVLKGFFSSSWGRPAVGDRLYFPLFAYFRTEINQSLTDFAEAHGGRLVLEKTFYERDGTTAAILLYRLDDAREFAQGFAERLLKLQLPEKLHISRFGPQPVKAGRDQDLAMWFIADDLTPSTKVVFEGQVLRTVFSGDHCTALVPLREVQRSGSYRIFLYDPERGIKSPPVFLEVVE